MTENKTLEKINLKQSLNSIHAKQETMKNIHLQRMQLIKQMIKSENSKEKDDLANKARILGKKLKL